MPLGKVLGKLRTFSFFAASAVVVVVKNVNLNVHSLCIFRFYIRLREVRREHGIIVVV